MQKLGRDYWTCPSMKIKKSPGKMKSPFRFTDLVSMAKLSYLLTEAPYCKIYDIESKQFSTPFLCTT